MPPVALTAIPDPAPVTLTVSFVPTKLAVTVFVAVSITRHGPVGLVQAPLQPPERRTRGRALPSTSPSVPLGGAGPRWPGDVGRTMPEARSLREFVPAPPPAQGHGERRHRAGTQLAGED